MEILCGEFRRTGNSNAAGALAAARSADGDHGFQAFGSQTLGNLPFFFTQRCRAADDAGKDASSGRRTADTQIAAGTAGNFLTALPGLRKTALKVDFAAAVMIGGDQNSRNDAVMFRTVHMDRRQLKNLLQKDNRILFRAVC